MNTHNKVCSRAQAAALQRLLTFQSIHCAGVQVTSTDVAPVNQFIQRFLHGSRHFRYQHSGRSHRPLTDFEGRLAAPLNACIGFPGTLG